MYTLIPHHVHDNQSHDYIILFRLTCINFALYSAILIYSLTLMKMTFKFSSTSFRRRTITIQMMGHSGSPEDTKVILRSAFYQTKVMIKIWMVYS